jgi:hypothetical protein
MYLDLAGRQIKQFNNRLSAVGVTALLNQQHRRKRLGFYTLCSTTSKAIFSL